MDFQHEKGKICARDEEGNIIAEACYYEKENGDWNIDHVYVNHEYRGQGIAEEAMDNVANYLRENGMKTSATCPYAKAWIKKNKASCHDIISKNHRL